MSGRAEGQTSWKTCSPTPGTERQACTNGSSIPNTGLPLCLAPDTGRTCSAVATRGRVNLGGPFTFAYGLLFQDEQNWSPGRRPSPSCLGCAELRSRHRTWGLSLERSIYISNCWGEDSGSVHFQGAPHRPLSL